MTGSRGWSSAGNARGLIEAAGPRSWPRYPSSSSAGNTRGLIEQGVPRAAEPAHARWQSVTWCPHSEHRKVSGPAPAVLACSSLAVLAHVQALALLAAVALAASVVPAVRASGLDLVQTLRHWPARRRGPGSGQVHAALNRQRGSRTSSRRSFRERPRHLAGPAPACPRPWSSARPGPATALDAGLTRKHHESRRRQYGLADRARRLGWNEPMMVDDDLGRSDGGSASSQGSNPVWRAKLPAAPVRESPNLPHENGAPALRCASRSGPASPYPTPHVVEHVVERFDTR